jgi:hypothetical protein
MQSALHVQSIFLEISHLATAKNINHSAPELRPAETTKCASHLEALLQAAAEEHFLPLSSQSVSGRR